MPIARPALDPYTRMQMSAECIARARRTRHVACEERRKRVRLVDAANVPVGWWVACARVVIAANEHDIGGPHAAFATRQTRRTSAGTRPALACRKSPRTTRRVGAGALDQARQAREIGGRRAAGQRHAARAERRGLAEMNVGDEHRALPQPMKCALGVQRDALATHDGVQHAVVGARRRGLRRNQGGETRGRVELRGVCAAARRRRTIRGEL